ncbi:MAG: flavodoxin-dependent (E)-4-hydroxy-3-methylbut-2-enyl-diphosphate synthase [Lentisphaeria bacterium]|nr:flavodoxin-dependent (E)-4-hydroxy-3-methylbut-2-enyl-diphosphate synthase [Lentisphaeria bacterium]
MPVYSHTSHRRLTRALMVGHVKIGGGAPVSIQSMTNTDTRDIPATLAQIEDVAARGCEIIRVAVPDVAAAKAIRTLVDKSPIPVIADIHFDDQLALLAIENGAHGIRVNPGNISRPEALAAIAKAAAKAKIAVRVGVNSGSLEKELLETFGGATPEAMVRSALKACAFFEAHGCQSLKVSLKTSHVSSTVAACRLFAEHSDLPLHLGVTEAGTPKMGIIKSAVGIGALLLDGIGDTIRVSLTASPCEEIPVAAAILEAAGCRAPAPDIISCPTCGRTEVDLVGLTEAVEREVERLKSLGWTFHDKKIAVMGCVVNGPGEARATDLGIAGGKGKGALFRDGKVIRTLPEDDLLEAFIRELRRIGTPPGDGRGR